VYEALGYYPSEQKEFVYRGKKYLNTYIPPTLTSKCSDEALKEFSSIFEEHLNRLFSVKDYAETLLDFLCYTVQNPGKKITWAILVQGTYGNGKTYIQRLMSLVLGGSNVNSINASKIQSDYNGYAEGSQLLFIEEMRLYDRKEHEVMGNLKTLVSNTDIQINEKFEKLKPILNVTNYIMFTNTKDAIYLDKSERRYYIIATRQQTVEDVFRDFPDGYFDRLFGTLDKYPEAARRYFLERKIRPGFEPQGRAPETKVKEVFVEHSKDSLQLAVEEVMFGLPQKNVISSTHLFQILRIDIDQQWGDLRLSSAKLHHCLIRMGFESVEKRVKIDQKLHTLWIAPWAPEEARKDPLEYFRTDGIMI
jgi:hypothetical protein